MIDTDYIVNHCWFLTGATASGKSGISMHLAGLLDAEIIDPNESFSTSQYRDAALELIAEITGRNKKVLFVGGTALYLKALLRGMFEGPPADWDFRHEVEKEIEESGGEFLHERLMMLDPIAAHNIHPNDHRRIIRALEVHRVTGRPISHLQMEFDQGKKPEQCRVFAVRHARETLHVRIESRVNSMFERGLIDEVRGLVEKYGALSHTAAQAVGYREALQFLDDKRDLEKTQEQVLFRTRRFARHQETWFRNLSECEWVDIEADFEARAVAERILETGMARSLVT